MQSTGVIRRRMSVPWNLWPQLSLFSVARHPHLALMWPKPAWNANFKKDAMALLENIMEINIKICIASEESKIIQKHAEFKGMMSHHDEEEYRWENAIGPFDMTMSSFNLWCECLIPKMYIVVAQYNWFGVNILSTCVSHPPISYNISIDGNTHAVTVALSLCWWIKYSST